MRVVKLDTKFYFTSERKPYEIDMVKYEMGDYIPAILGNADIYDEHRQYGYEYIQLLMSATYMIAGHRAAGLRVEMPIVKMRWMSEEHPIFKVKEKKKVGLVTANLVGTAYQFPIL